MLLTSVALILGIVVLVVAADLFVVAAEGMALELRWSQAVIGAVVVGFGTSLPELVTSAVAAFAGEPELAIGNAAGSNVANLLLVLGIAAVVAPVHAFGRGPGRDVAIAVAGGGILTILASDGELGLLDGAVLLAALGLAVAWQVASGRGQQAEVAARGPGLASLAARAVGGLVGVVVGAQLLVWGASGIAVELGVPSIVIGSVLVAVGTSLPELATAIASARRGQTDLLIGNLIGSNAFNALGVVGAAAVVASARGDVLAVSRPAAAVVVVAAVVTLTVGGWLWLRPRVGRLPALLLVVVYAVSVPALAAIS